MIKTNNKKESNSKNRNKNIKITPNQIVRRLTELRNEYYKIL